MSQKRRGVKEADVLPADGSPAVDTSEMAADRYASLARRVQADHFYASNMPLWKPSALDLAAAVLALVAERDALQAALQAFFAEWDGEVGPYAPTDDTLALMRAAAGESKP